MKIYELTRDWDNGEQYEDARTFYSTRVYPTYEDLAFDWEMNVKPEWDGEGMYSAESIDSDTQERTVLWKTKYGTCTPEFERLCEEHGEMLCEHDCGSTEDDVVDWLYEDQMVEQLWQEDLYGATIDRLCAEQEAEWKSWDSWLESNRSNADLFLGMYNETYEAYHKSWSHWLQVPSRSSEGRRRYVKHHALEKQLEFLTRLTSDNRPMVLK